QRRGLNIGGGSPLYVLRLEPHSKRVIVGSKHELLQSTIILKEINWLGDEPLTQIPLDVSVKVRSMTPLLRATVRKVSNERGEVILKEPYIGIAPGQACVLYKEERLLGGGWIA
ncbi:MAG: aminomethyltransferase beta-barrel domain-containing protein, partial [Pseudomonadota bacterium]|nr:aminomethyltransferase beta-barrel domain-containing protein [Pseudomonadota bacterium]